MRLRLIIFALTVLFNFATNAQTNNNEKKPLRFDINKTVINIEKISQQNLEVLFKGRIIEKLDNNFYWVKDGTGKIKISISDEQISSIGNYSETNIFYITVKVKDFRKQTFIAVSIKKAE